MFLIMCDTTTASAEGICRTKNNRISDLICKRDTIFYIFNDQRSCNRLTDLFHGIFKFQTVFCFLDGFRRCTDQSHIMFLKESCFFQLHCKVQSGLASKGRKYAVRFFFKDQLFYNFYRKWFDINAVCNIFVCHDRCRVRIQKYNFKSFFLQ